MPFYTANNTKLTINGTGYYVSNATINSSASISPVLKVGSEVSEEYAQSQSIQGGLSMSYYLTGSDPLKQLISDESPVSGNFCGLYFSSGYLNGYSLDMVPNQPLRVSTSFSFYSKIKGTFAPVRNPLADIATLNCSDFRFNETGVVGGNKITSLSYQYSTNITPFFSIQNTGEEVSPSRVVCDGKSVSLNVVTNDYSLGLPSTGTSCKGTINLKNSAGVIKESYDISGVMNSEDISVSPSDPILKNIQISQANLGLPPSVDGLTPAAGVTGATVTISGSNFKDVEGVYFKGDELSFSAPVNQTGINAIIPTTVPTGGVYGGPIVVKTMGGSSMSTGVFTVS